MNLKFNDFSVHDLQEMLTKMRSLVGEDHVTELIEISEGFEAVMSQSGFDESQEHQRLLRLLGWTWEMERRMKDLELTLERIGDRIQALSARGQDTSLMDQIHRLPDYVPDGICE